MLVNGSAALAGWALGAAFLGPTWTNRALAECAADPVATASTLATLTASTIAWVASGTRSARAAIAIVIPGALGALARPAAFFAAATWANALTPQIRTLFHRYGTLPATAAPLAAAAITAAAAWMLLGPRSRHWPTPLAWLARVPTATTLLALALYTPSR